MRFSRRLIEMLLVSLLVASCQSQPEDIVLPTEAVLFTATPPPSTTPTQDFATLPPPPPTPTFAPLPPERDLAPRTEAQQFAVSSAPGFFNAPEGFEPGDIYVVGVDGTHARITINPAQDTAPLWSGDGSRIFFVSDRDGVPRLYVINAENQNPVQPVAPFDTEDQRQPALSPGDINIAFTTNRGGSDDIYTMTADGRSIQPLITDPAPDYEADYSPDNRWLVFTSERDGNPELYLLNLLDNAVYRLTDHPGLDNQAVFSPDGRRIAFISDRNGFPQVFVMNLPTPQLTFDELREQPRVDVLGGRIPPLELDTAALPPRPLPLTSDPTPKQAPHWILKPSGGFGLAYTALQAGTGGETRRQSYTMNDDGSGINLIGDITLSFASPVPRPPDPRALR